MTTRDGAAEPRILAVNDVETAFDDPNRIGRLAGGIRAYTDESTLLLDAGDSTALGSLAFVTEEGRGQARPFHQTVAPDAHVPGNHDFDNGPDWLAEFATATPGKWLAANVNVDGVFEESHVFEVDGADVAVIGVAHPETDTFCAAADTVTFTDPAAAVKNELRALDAVDYSVVLSHCGHLDREIARETAADIVIGGHDHRRTVERIAGTLVCRTAGKGHEFLEVTLGSPADATVHETSTAEPLDALVEEYRARMDATGLTNRITQLEPLTPDATAELIASAYRSGAEAEVGLVFEASVREPLGGNVTRGDVVGVVPFSSELVSVELPGDRLRSLVRSADDPIDETHGHVILTGPEGRMVASGDDQATRLAVDGIDDAHHYRVGMMSYVPQSEVLPGIRDDDVVATHGPQHEHVLTYLRQKGTPIE